MWILKGVLLGSTIFVIGTLAYLVIANMRPLETSHATGLSVITGMTISNPFFWTALFACLLLGISLVASWPVPVK